MSVDPGLGTHSVADLLAQARQQFTDVGIPASDAQLEARLLFQHASGIAPERLIGNQGLTTSDSVANAFAESVRRRVEREPLPYIVQEAHFYGRTFLVTREVLIPRPETEQLVDLAIAFTGEHNIREPRICDIGTGSGVIAISLALELPHAKLTACDISATALDVAQRNASRHEVSERVEFIHQDVIHEVALVPQGSYDIVASNPPYIPTDRLQHELEPEVSQWEPRLALDGGHDGMRVIEPLIKQLPQLLKPRRPAAAFIEIDQETADCCATLANAALPTAKTEVLQDLARLDRVLSVRL